MIQRQFEGVLDRRRGWVHTHFDPAEADLVLVIGLNVGGTLTDASRWWELLELAEWAVCGGTREHEHGTWAHVLSLSSLFPAETAMQGYWDVVEEAQLELVRQVLRLEQQRVAEERARHLDVLAELEAEEHAHAPEPRLVRQLVAPLAGALPALLHVLALVLAARPARLPLGHRVRLPDALLERPRAPPPADSSQSPRAWAYADNYNYYRPTSRPHAPPDPCPAWLPSAPILVTPLRRRIDVSTLVQRAHSHPPVHMRVATAPSTRSRATTRSYGSHARAQQSSSVVRAVVSYSYSYMRGGPGSRGIEVIGHYLPDLNSHDEPDISRWLGRFIRLNRVAVNEEQRHALSNETRHWTVSRRVEQKNEERERKISFQER
ncbi:hypothetical protein FIBSPDRAFT_924866, partial [Athelia psychrophila]